MFIQQGFLTGLTCFHCRQTGHKAATCPETNKEGSIVGVCYKCGSTTHTTKNCKKDTTKGIKIFISLLSLMKILMVVAVMMMMMIFVMIGIQ